jgi:hypothetical protein
VTPLLQIVPDLPPAWGGVGGFAAAVAEALRQRGTASHFLVAQPAWAGDGGLDGEPIAARNRGALAHQLAATRGETLLVHYVNYAYHDRGCPSWLIDGVLAWRHAPRGSPIAAPQRRLVTFFHEVYASGPPWRSSFWLHPAQRRLAARLARGSDGAATSLSLYAGMLSRWRQGRAVLVAPIPSTIGEPPIVPLRERRRPRTLVVFGGKGNRQRAYGELAADLAQACRVLDVEEIADLGEGLSSLPATVGGVPVRALGPLGDAAASAILRGAFAGFVGYPPPFLEKSSVFAAYCAHGVVPVTAWRGTLRRRHRGETPPPPSWNVSAEPPPDDPAALAARASDWYAGHSLEHTATSLHGLLAGPAGDCQISPGGGIGKDSEGSSPEP